MWINSVHVVCGALVLTTSLVLTLRTWRPRFAAATVPVNVRLKPDATNAIASSDAAASTRSARLQPDGTTGVRA
jgi:hypothetical protein